MSVFSDLKPRNHAARNGFDLGRFSTFSSKAGYIIPVFQQETLPSSEYSLDIKQLLRTQPLQKAAFTGFSINYDVVWMPYNHLYSSFNQFIAQRENKNLVYQPTHSQIPRFNLGKFVRHVFYFALWDYIMSFVEDYPDGNDIPSQGGKILFISEQMPNDSVCLSVLRNLDMLGYGNYLPYLKNMYARLCSTEYTFGIGEGVERTLPVDWSHWNYTEGADKTTWTKWPLVEWLRALFGISQNADTGDIDETPQSLWSKIYPYFDEISPFGTVDSMGYIFSLLNDKHPNLWPVFAYNKAFYEYYRNTYYDQSFRLGSVMQIPAYCDSWNYVMLFNGDDITFVIDDISPSSSMFYRLLCMFAVKPHLYKRDLFTGVLPSTQYGDVSVMSAEDVFANLVANYSSTSVTKSLDAGQVYSSGSAVVQKGSSGSVSLNADKYKFDPAVAISMLEFRKADAMQRFKERMMRAGDKTKDIFVAHGWSEPKSESSFEPIFLGSFDGRLDINVVASTNDSDNVQLGQLGANGMAVVNGHKVKIKTSDFGVLMVLFHIEKDAVYDSYGLKLQHTRTEPFDYPYPELQNISLAPVPTYAFNLFEHTRSDVIGFLPRSIDLKTAVDEVHGEFFSALPYTFNGEDFVNAEWPDGSPFVGRNKVAAFVTGAFSDWVAPREDMLTFNQLSFLYVNPHCVDTIFAQMSNVRQDSDQFFINARFDCYAVEPLPVIGLPI